MDPAPQLPRWPYLERHLNAFRWGIFLGTVGLGLVTVFVLWSSQGLVDQANDIYDFGKLGHNIAKGEGLHFNGGPPTIRRAPLYPIFIAFLYTVFGAHTVAIQLAQCLLAGGTALLTFEIGRHLMSARVGFIAAVVTALHPAVMRYVPDIQLECFLTFLYTLTVYRTVRLVEHESLLNGFWVGASAALASMTKGVALPYAALFILVYLILRRVRRKPDEPAFPGIRPVAALLVAMALVILPWTFRNYQVTGRFVLISGNASGEFLRGYVFAQPKYFLLKARAYEEGENEANEMQHELFRRQGLVRERDEVETEMVYNKAAKEKIRSSPLAFVKKFIIAWFMFWYVVTSLPNSLVMAAFALGGWALAAVGWWRTRGQGLQLWVLLLPILSLNFIYAAVLALGRYSAPAIPTLVVLSALGIHSLLADAAKNRNKVGAAPA